MNHRYITLEEGDTRLRSYLDGEVAAGDSRANDSRLRPVLVASLNPGLSEFSREWTFELFPLAEIARPTWSLTWLKALRPDMWVLTLVPLLATLGLATLTQAEAVDFSLAVFAALGVIALHASIQLFSDCEDYQRGWDRVAERGGARVIGRGWLRAKDVRRAAWTAFALALGFGLLVFSKHFSPRILASLIAAVTALALAASRLNLKHRGFAEVLAWFLFGPLLTAGYMWAITNSFSWRAVAFGSLFGSIALLVLHLKNFERILVDGQAKLPTWPVRAGFDASKSFTYFCGALAMASAAVLLVYADPATENLLIAINLALGLGPLLQRVQQLKSPVAGRMQGLHRSALRLAWLNGLAFFAVFLVRQW